MATFRFKFSDIFSTAWFFNFHQKTHKKKNNKKKSKPPDPIPPPSTHPLSSHRLSHSRKSYYITRGTKLPECPPINITRGTKLPECPPVNITRGKTIPECPPVNPTTTTTTHPGFPKSPGNELQLRSDTTLPTEPYTIFKNNGGGYDLIPSGGGLRRIVTRHGRSRAGCRKVEAASPGGVMVRGQSPRTRGGRRRRRRRRSMSWGSRAVVKETVEPERDFRESMKEMIMEKGLREGPDLEELLACYLSLNSPEYHPLIISAFTHTCFHHLSPPFPRFSSY